MFVLDSNVLIDIFAGSPALVKISKIVGSAHLVTTSICMHEVLAGAESEKQLFQLKGLLGAFTILEYDRKAAEIGGTIEQVLLKQGAKIPKADILIGATCIREHATLITRDKHFLKMPRLKRKIIE